MGEPCNRSATDYDHLRVVLGDGSEAFCKQRFLQINFRPSDVSHGPRDYTRRHEFASEAMCVRDLYVPGLETGREANDGVAISKHVGGKECCF